MRQFSAVDVIKTKRDGGSLSKDQIHWFIDGYSKRDVEHQQASALLMAICWRGMDSDELAQWTSAMIESGSRLDLSEIAKPTVDKHSTGGVGDKISLILAPMIAACGAVDPMLSGRGLGHTGGTLDKLESIAGFRVDLSPAEIMDTLDSVGCVICAAGPDLVPADKKLYALRDVTGTVESIPLIASSIMSKKIVEGTSALVLDVKVGSGAFLPNIDDARELAVTMVGLGETHGVKTTALLTTMDVPIGKAVGNALEVAETLDVLRGKGPADTIEITVALAEAMLELVGIEADPRTTLADGSALAKFEAMVKAQGGDLSAPLPQAGEQQLVTAQDDGYVVALDAKKIGVGAWRLGAGRARMDDKVVAAAGIVCLKKPGDEVAAGDPVLELHADQSDLFAPAMALLEGAVEVGQEPPNAAPLVIERIGP